MSRYIDVDKKIEEINVGIESITKLIENRPYDEEAKLILREYKFCLHELERTPIINIEKSWVNFSDEKPTKNGYYFCYHMTSKCENKEHWQMQMLYWEDNLWLYHHSTFKTADYVSHWMSLPKPPKEKDE